MPEKSLKKCQNTQTKKQQQQKNNIPNWQQFVRLIFINLK